MKIYPRRIRVSEDKLGYEFSINNSSSDDRILLFRIRRAEEKLLTFAPKKGFIMPGETQTIQVTALSSHFDKTKLLVKLVVVPRVEVLQEFEQSWHIGETVGGVVKKIVDFYGTESHDVDDHRSHSSRGSALRQHEMDKFSEVLSEASSFSFTSPSKAHSVRSSAEFKSQSEMSFSDALNDSFRSEASTLKLPTYSNAPPDFRNNNNPINAQTTVNLVDVLKILAASQQLAGPSLVNQSLDTALSKLNVSSDVAALVSLLQQPQGTHQNPHADNLSKISHITPEHTFRESMDSIASADLKSFVDRHSVMKRSPTKGNKAAQDDNVDDDEKDEEQELQQSINELSRLSATKLGSNISRTSNVNTLEIHGEEIDDSILKKVVESRLVGAIKTREKIAAVEINHTNLISLKTSICRVFEYQPTQSSQEGGDVETKEQLRALQSSYLEDHLRSLTVSHSRLLSLDDSINRFNNLTHLYLQHNRIRKLDNMLQLPHLQLIDLSYNQLTSLDFLQELHSLHSLYVSSNKISSITQSINMLIPLALNITTLNMSHNPVCQDFKYAEATILALPKLKYFDEVHIDSLYKHNYSSNASNNTRNKSKFSGAASTMLSVENKRMKGKGKVALPNFPCQEKKKSTGDKNKDEFIVKLRRALGLRVYQTRRERLNPSPSFQPEGEKSRPPRRSSPIQANRGYSFADEESVGDQSQQYDNESVDERSQDGGYDAEVNYSRSYNYNEQEAERNYSEAPVQQSHRTVYEPPQQQIQQQQYYPQPAPTYNQSMSYEQAPRPSSAPPRTRPVSQPVQVSPSNNSYSAPTRAQPSQVAPSVTPAKLNTSTSSAASNNSKRSTSPKQFSFANIQTSGSKQRRKSQAVSLVQHWTGHKSEQSVMDSSSMSQHVPHHTREAPVSPASSLLQPTGATIQRRKSFGILNTDFANSVAMSSMQSPSSLGRGYHSDGELSASKRTCRGQAAAKLSQEKFGEMQEDERYSIWHPRYKVPRPIFGFSKPFLHRKTPEQIGYAPLYDKTIQRIRDGFEKLPTRGTFTRSSKGLTAEFYPMDFTDLEAIRRQGYFHETIGDIQKDSYKDLSSPKRGNQSTTINSMEAIINPATGSVTLSPLKKGRRASIGQHVSRQYKSSFDGNHSMASLNQPSDDYSGFRKWHHGQIEEGQDEKYDLYDSNAQSAVYKNSVFADSADMSAVNNADGNNSTMISPNSGAVRKTSVMSHLFGSVVVDGLEDEAGANNNNNPDSTRSRKDDFSSFFDATQSPHHFDKQANPEEEEGEQVLPEGDGEEEQQESAALVSYLSWLEEQQSNSQHLDDDDDDDDHPMIVPLRHPRDLAMREAQREDSRPNSPGGSVGSGSGRNPMHILFRNNNNNNAANGDNASVGRGDTTSYI